MPILGFTALFAIAYGWLHYEGYINVWPTSATLQKWDAFYYASIRDHGYIYEEKVVCNAGFFPLFAYWWWAIPLSALGISILNGLIYLTSLFFLCRLFKPSLITLGLFMSLPCMFFFFTPLSESLFFCFGTLIIYGIHRKNYRLLIAGLFLATLTRASFLFFVPASVGMVLMSFPIQQVFTRKLWRSILHFYLPPVASALAMVVVIQYLQTGEWFAYFKVQSTAWGRAFAWPTFPLGRNADWTVIDLSQVNFWLGLSTAFLGLFLLIQWLRQKNIIQKINPATLFSLIFVIMSFLGVVLFNPVWHWHGLLEKNTTSLVGINRYLQPTPFFFVTFLFLVKKRSFSFLKLLGLGAVTHLTWLLVEPKYYIHIQKYLPLIPITAPIIIYWIYAWTHWKLIGWGLIILSFFLQAYFYSYFMIDINMD